MSASGGGDRNIMSVVHLLDSEVPQVLVGFWPRIWRIWGKHLQAWPLALGLVGA